MSLTIGIDLGTSGCRAVCIDSDHVVVAETSASIESPVSDAPGHFRQQAGIWWQATVHVLTKLCEQIDTADVKSICTDGTSSSLLLCDEHGNPLSKALMYNDTSSRQAADQVRQLVPQNNPAQGPASSLSKLISLSRQHPQARYALHQADWITGKLSGQWGISDTNNCLKLGYDPVESQWPDWIRQLEFDQQLLPGVQSPGTLAGNIRTKLARQLRLPATTMILSGTTDSTAAFIATAANKIGDAVTSLGSTLVTKVICTDPISDHASGIYSHRVFDFWVAGGASNSGGAALLSVFDIEEIKSLTLLIKPDQETGLGYYPLPAPGERFPVVNPDMLPRMPDAMPADKQSRAIILQGMFEGIARIEADAYQKLHALGAPCPTKVLTTGGGSVNNTWNIIRQHILGIPVKQAPHHQAAYGAAVLAQKYS